MTTEGSDRRDCLSGDREEQEGLLSGAARMVLQDPSAATPPSIAGHWDHMPCPSLGRSDLTFHPGDAGCRAGCRQAEQGSCLSLQQHLVLEFDVEDWGEVCRESRWPWVARTSAHTAEGGEGGYT